MAAWIAHIRLAENLLKYGFKLDIPAFLAGNVAPDSGLPSAAGFTPNKRITHWKDTNGNTQPEDFYAAHVEGKNLDLQEYAFLIGYYLHLVADVEFIGNIVQPNMKSNPLWIALDLNNDEDAARVKKDWYGLDFCYLHQHPESLYFSHFLNIEELPDYLDYFPEGVFTKAIQRIKAYYSDAESMELSLRHDYPYLNEADLLTWIDCTTVTMLGLLKSKGVPCPNPQPLFGERYIQTAL
jgi:hypothetical protein